MNVGLLPEAFKKPQSWVRKVCVSADGDQVCVGFLQANGGLIKKKALLARAHWRGGTCESRIQLKE